VSNQPFGGGVVAIRLIFDRSGIESEGLGGKPEGIGECLGQVQALPVALCSGALLTDSPDLDESGRKVLDGESIGGDGVARALINRTKVVSDPHQ